MTGRTNQGFAMAARDVRERRDRICNISKIRKCVPPPHKGEVGAYEFAAVCGFVFRVVKRIGYFVPNRGRPPRSSPGNVLARTRAVLISGGEDFGYFALTEPP
jgi:hypothetical protein